MVVHILVDGRVVPPKIIERILAYFFMYFVTVLLSLLVISLSGLDMQQTMDVAVACLTSTGQMMLFHSSYAEIHHLPDWIKLYCCLIMIIGKINIFTFLLVLSGGWSKLQTRHWSSTKMNGEM